MALGADARRIRLMVLRQGLALAAAGTLGGLALALPVTRMMQGLLVGVTPTDPLTFGTVAAYRASRVDPLVVLRAE